MDSGYSKYVSYAYLKVKRIYLCKRVALTALLLLLFITSPVQSSTVIDYDINLTQKCVHKMKEMGEELYQKSGVSTAIVARESMDKPQFLDLKNRYLHQLKPPYVVWFFTRKYYDNDVKRTGKLNLLISSDDLKGKYDESSMFSPFSGTFMRLITIKKSKTDPTSAAFLNGYGDLTSMLADSYGITLKSGIGNETHTTMDIVRFVVYLTFLFFFLWYIKVKFFHKG